MIHDVHLLILTVQALYRFRCSGPPELVGILEMALESQSLHGYPRPAPRLGRPVPRLPDYRYTLHVRVPPGEPQLTHGTYKHLDLEKSRWKMHKL